MEAAIYDLLLNNAWKLSGCYVEEVVKDKYAHQVSGE